MANEINPGPGGIDAYAVELGEAFLAAFPGRILSVYLLGSRAVGREIESSDLDLGLVFSGRLGRGERDRAWEFLHGRPAGPVPVELVLLDEAGIARGVRPRIQQGRLLLGEDVLKGRPLLPRSELLGHFAYSAAYFIWLVRNKPVRLRYPLGYPAPGQPFEGYTDAGRWEGGDRFSPGLDVLVNLVLSVANFRLALEGIYFPSKAATAEEYRRAFPGGPWTDLVEEVYEYGRIRWKGRLPAEEGDRERIREWCPQILAFENEFLDGCIRRILELLSIEDEELRSRLASFAGRTITESPEHNRVLAIARERLGPPAPVKEVSVIVPFFGEPAALRTTLLALSAQDYPPERVEILVVDNGSGADLGPLRREFPAVRWLEESRPGSYAARNRGLAESRGRVLAFTDSDCLPDRSWLAEGLKALAETGADAIGGKVEYLDPGRPLNLYEKIEENYFLLGRQQYLIEKLGVAATANLFATRQAFDDVGPFDSSLKSFGDGDWTKRAIACGKSLRYAEGARVRHPRRHTFEAIRRKLIRVSGGRMSLMKRNREPARRFAANLLSYSVLDPRLHLLPLRFRASSLGERLKFLLVMEALSLEITWTKLRVIFGGRAERR